MLPEGWKRTTFGEVTRIASGQVDPTSEPFIDMLHIGPEDIESNTGRVLEPKTCRQLGLISGKYEFDERAVVYSKIRPHLNKVCFPKFKGVCSADAYPIWPDEKQLTAEYLALYMLGPAFEKRAVACSMRTGMPKINREDLDSIPILIPPLPHQRSIAEVVKAWDAAIGIAEKLLLNSCQQKQALLQNLLRKRSNDWEQTCLAGISTRVQRQSDGQEYPVLMISSGRGFVRQDEKYSRFMAGRSLENYVLLQEGEFAYNKGNSKLYEFGCVFPLEGIPLGLVPHVYVCFKMNARCDRGFYKYLFEADYLHDQLGALVNTGVRNNGLLNIRPADFMNVRVPLPPLAEQRAVASVLDTASKEFECIKKDLEALKRQKRALMQQLLTGKRRALLPDQEAVEV